MSKSQENWSRRRLFRGAATAAGAGLLSFTSEESATGQSTPRVLALIGDRYHNPDYIRVSLDRVFGDLKLPVDYTINYEKLSRDLLKNYQLFVCLRDGMIWPNGYLGPDAYESYEHGLENTSDFAESKLQSWITEEQGAAVKEFVISGNGFYSLHNNSHVSLSSKNYRDVMGGAYIGHPPLRPFKVRVVNKEHPITQGVDAFIVNDEQHYVEYDKDRKHILLESENIDGLGYENLGTKSIAGWAYEYGKGRVVFTAVGHTNHALWIPAYLRLQKQAVEWLLKRTS
jgi:type 1 glutamine amidotransferase